MLPILQSAGEGLCELGEVPMRAPEYRMALAKSHPKLRLASQKGGATLDGGNQD